MNIRKLMLAGSALAVMTAAPAQASIIDNPHFKVLGLVIVWGADASGTAPMVSDFVIDSDATGSNDADLIASNVHTVVTGSLTPTPTSLAGSSPFSITDGTNEIFNTDSSGDGFLDATDSFTAFSIDGSTDITTSDMIFNSSFYVASNTAFNIEAQASVATSDNFVLSDVGYALGVTADGTGDATSFGSNAQVPGTVVGGITTLDDLDNAAPIDVFTGTQRTAASAGSIIDQSVRFDATYTLGGVTGYDLSMGAGEIEADVTYTVYVP